MIETVQFLLITELQIRYVNCTIITKHKHGESREQMHTMTITIFLIFSICSSQIIKSFRIDEDNMKHVSTNYSHEVSYMPTTSCLKT